jgi:hypothetical protein
MLSLTCASTHVAAGSSNRATTRSRNCPYSSSGIASTSDDADGAGKLPRFGEARLQLKSATHVPEPG